MRLPPQCVITTLVPAQSRSMGLQCPEDMLQDYDDLRDGRMYFAAELQSLAFVNAAARIRRAAAFPVGSPTEFIVESLYTLDDVVAETSQLPGSLVKAMRGVVD